MAFTGNSWILYVRSIIIGKVMFSKVCVHSIRGGGGVLGTPVPDSCPGLWSQVVSRGSVPVLAWGVPQSQAGGTPVLARGTTVLLGGTPVPGGYPSPGQGDTPIYGTKSTMHCQLHTCQVESPTGIQPSMWPMATSNQISQLHSDQVKYLSHCTVQCRCARFQT